MYVLKGGGLPFDAKPAQLHFHWGTTPERGSEHTIDGRPFSAEVIMMMMTMMMMIIPIRMIPPLHKLLKYAHRTMTYDVVPI